MLPSFFIEEMHLFYFREPVVCGITALDYDHTSLLGSTIESIAWHKAGIFKKDVAAVVSPQRETALQVIRDRAFEKEVYLFMIHAI